MDIPFDVTNVRLETDRLILRAFSESDLDDFYAYASVPGVGEMAGWSHHKSKDTSKVVLRSFLEGKEVFALYHKNDGKVIGSLGIHKLKANDEEEYKDLKIKSIGYVLSKDYWGQGLMPEAIKAVIEYGFDILNLDAFICGHFSDNIQSKRVIEKCGFSFTKRSISHMNQLERDIETLNYILLKISR